MAQPIKLTSPQIGSPPNPSSAAPESALAVQQVAQERIGAPSPSPAQLVGDSAPVYQFSNKFEEAKRQPDREEAWRILCEIQRQAESPDCPPVFAKGSVFYADLMFELSQFFIQKLHEAKEKTDHGQALQILSDIRSLAESPHCPRGYAKGSLFYVDLLVTFVESSVNPSDRSRYTHLACNEIQMISKNTYTDLNTLDLVLNRLKTFLRSLPDASPEMERLKALSKSVSEEKELRPLPALGRPRKVTSGDPSNGGNRMRNIFVAVVLLGLSALFFTAVWRSYSKAARIGS